VTYQVVLKIVQAKEFAFQLEEIRDISNKLWKQVFIGTQLIIASLMLRS
jgi:hypothetical protein